MKSKKLSEWITPDQAHAVTLMQEISPDHREPDWFRIYVNNKCVDAELTLDGGKMRFDEMVQQVKFQYGIKEAP